MLIYILRHGDAISDPKLLDSERPLSNLGAQQAALIGKYLLDKNEQIEVLLVSPMLRARQTAEIVNRHIGIKQIIVTELLLNGADIKELFQYLNELNAKSVMLIGHIPHLEDTCELLIGEVENKIKLRKCSLAIIEITKPIVEGNGTLLQLIHVDDINQ